MAKNPERPAEPNCLTRIFIINARHDSHFDDVVLRPFCLEGSQQVCLKSLELAVDELGRISKKENVDATVPSMMYPARGLRPSLRAWCSNERNSFLARLSILRLDPLDQLGLDGGNVRHSILLPLHVKDTIITSC